MRIENRNYQSGYKITVQDSASSGKFKDTIAEFMKSGSDPANTRQKDTFEKTSNATMMNNTTPVNEASNESKSSTLPQNEKNSSAVIIDMELYERLKSDSKNNNYQIAKALIENNAVNVENIDPKNCTELELSILEISLMKSKGQEYMAVDISSDRILMQFISKLRGENASFSEQKHDWIEKWHEHLKMLIDVGNKDFDRYEKVDQYLEELISYADSLKE